MRAHADDDAGLPEARWCVVTGGRGFMARYLVAALLRSGEWRVRVTDVAPAIMLGHGEMEELLGNSLNNGRAVYASADVCVLDQLLKVFEGVEVVFHTAAADPNKNNMVLHYKVNVDGTKNVIDACKICKVKRLIYTSSSSVVFDGVHGLFEIDESMPYPDKFPDPYAQTKAEAEKLVMKANNINKLSTCCIRSGGIFGAGDVIIPNVDRCQRMLLIIGDGKNYEDFIYVENVVHGHLCAEKTLSSEDGAKISGGKAYFITNMEPTNLWCFLRMISEELGYRRHFKIRIPSVFIVPVIYVIEWAYNFLGMQEPQITSTRIKYVTQNRTYSCYKAIKELGYRPIVALKDGVTIAVQSYIELRDAELITLNKKEVMVKKITGLHTCQG